MNRGSHRKVPPRFEAGPGRAVVLMAVSGSVVEQVGRRRSESKSRGLWVPGRQKPI